MYKFTSYESVVHYARTNAPALAGRIGSIANEREPIPIYAVWENGEVPDVLVRDLKSFPRVVTHTLGDRWQVDRSGSWFDPNSSDDVRAVKEWWERQAIR